MNSRKKGRETELRAKKDLEAEGWNVVLVDMPQKFKKSQDLFGCWDIIACKPGIFKLVQVKTNQWGDIRECKSFKEEYFFAHSFVTCEIWMWKNRKWSVREL